MKIAVIGANGNLGSRVIKYALMRGHIVKAIIYNGSTPDERTEILEKSLFDLTSDDFKDVEVVISAFGGGLSSNPVINKDAFVKYIELLDNTDKKLIAIGGAGSLFTSEERSLYEYESPAHPQMLKEISENIKLGIDEIEKVESFDWTVVCPSRKFDLEGPYTGEYIVGEDNIIIFNDNNESYVTYEDLASAMVDIAESKKYKQKKITIATKK
ncbi:NAD(P)-dependent oxidoreductase [Clostridium saccharoperbutylacetonicum]